MTQAGSPECTLAPASYREPAPEAKAGSITNVSPGFSKKLDNLKAAVSIFMAYYNFVWRTRYPDYSGGRGQLRRPAAMLAGVVDTLWDFPRLFDEAMAYC